MTQARRPDNPFAATGRRRARTRSAGRITIRDRSRVHSRSLGGDAPSTRALDVACGTGMSTRRARAMIADVVVGVDVSPEMLAVAARVRSGAYSCVDARSVCRSPIAIVRRGHVLLRRALVRPAALLRRGAPACCDPAAGSRSTTTTSSARWSTCPSSASGRRVALDAVSRCRRATRRSAIRAPRRPTGFEKVGDEFFADDIDMTHAAVRRLPALDQQLRRRASSAARHRDELRGVAARVDARRSSTGVADARTVRFLGSITCLRVASRSSRRSGLPPALRGISSTIAQLARQLRGRRAGRARTRAASSSDGGRRAIGRRRRTRRRVRPTRRRATPTMHTSRTAAWWARTPSTSVGLTFTPPVITRSFLRSTTRDAAVDDLADVAGARATRRRREHLGRLRRDRGGSRASPSRRARAARASAARRASAPAIGTPSSAQPPHVSVMPYASTTCTPSASARAPQRRRARRAADDHAAVLVHRRAARRAGAAAWSARATRSSCPRRAARARRGRCRSRRARCTARR